MTERSTPDRGRMRKPKTLRGMASAFGRDRSGSTAIEFGVVGLLLITVLLATIQFSLLFLSQMRLHDTLADIATGANMALLADNAGLRRLICGNLILIDNCETTLLIEKAPLLAFPAAQQPITGTTFATGATGDAMLIRAAVDVVSFVPGLPKLPITGTALFPNP